MHVVKQIIHAVALFLIIGWKFLADPHGTTDQAVVLVRTHFADVRRIAAIVEKDRTLRWVTPGSDAEDRTSENRPPTAGTKAYYDAIAAHVAATGGRACSVSDDFMACAGTVSLSLVRSAPGVSAS